MHIYFVRHGQSVGNVNFIPGKIRPKDDPLTELGYKEAANAAKYIESQRKKPGIIFCSPYTRAHETALAVKALLDVPLITDPRLGEYNPGDWDGLHVDDFNKKFDQVPFEDRGSFRPPNGESRHDEATRVKALIEGAMKSNQKTIVIVSHLDPIKAAINLLTDKSLNENTSLRNYKTGSVTTLVHDVVWSIIDSWPSIDEETIS